MLNRVEQEIKRERGKQRLQMLLARKVKDLSFEEAVKAASEYIGEPPEPQFPDATLDGF